MNALPCLLLIAITASTASHTAFAPKVENAGFELPDEAARSGEMKLPDGWNLFTSSDQSVEAGVTSAHASEGEQACVLKSNTTAGEFYGLLQEIDVTPGQQVTLEADVRNDPSNPMSGSVTGQLSFEWLDSGNEVDRSYSGDWNQSLRANQWTPVTLAAAAPDKATRVRIVITLRNGDAPTGGAFLIDNLRVDASGR